MHKDEDGRNPYAINDEVPSERWPGLPCALLFSTLRLGAQGTPSTLSTVDDLADTQSAYIDAQTDIARTWAEVVRATGGIQP